MDTKKAKVGKYEWNVTDVVRSGGHAASLEGQKKGKKRNEEIRDIIIVQDPDTVQVMEHVRGGRKLVWNALSFENTWGGGSLNASRNQRVLKVER